MGKHIIAYVNANLKYGFKWQRINQWKSTKLDRSVETVGKG